MDILNPTSQAPAFQRFRHRFEAHVNSEGFPCVGARSALSQGRCRFGLYGPLGHPCSAARLCLDLKTFSNEFPNPGLRPASFVAMFDDSVSTEAEFEDKLWRQLQETHDHDSRDSGWDARVSSDPANPNFSFSVGGRAFFVVGMSPVASRIARRAPMPCLVFNFHDQFEELRASGKYEGFQRVIRERDMALQGDLNPALTLFGEQSEARQYAGVATTADWECPFSTRGGDGA